jgi:peptidoglycan/LPS O-acetylase OafA/YrhL
VYYGADTHADGLLAGSAAGILVSSGLLRSTPALERGLNWAGHFTLGILFLFLCWGWAGDSYVLQAGLLVLNLAMTSMVVCLMMSPGPILRWFFEFPPLMWIGRVSYGLYLWHMLVFGRRGTIPLLKSAGSWAVTVAVTIGVAAVSFYALEQPLLRLKRRFERVPASAP